MATRYDDYDDYDRYESAGGERRHATGCDGVRRYRLLAPAALIARAPA
ncbi:hypothetical protein PXJ20_18710 [Paraburkholderia sp. A1RI_3L]